MKAGVETADGRNKKRNGLIPGLLLAGVFYFTAQAEFPGEGSGTPADPYRVGTAEKLDAVRNHLGAHFLQTADIDLGVPPWNEGEGWVPIGTEEIPFTGMYDGGGHAVSGLRIARADGDRQGLFGSASGARIVHLGVTGFDLEVRHRSGGLAGQLEYGSVVSNCYSTGVISAASRSGGLVGAAQWSSRIEQSGSEADVTGSDERIGGLAGQSWTDGTVSGCYAAGNVTGTRFTGGLVGLVVNSVVENSHATGHVTGTDVVGGLAGYQYAGLVSGCHASGGVGGADDVGGLVGGCRKGWIRDSFALGPVTAIRWVGGLTGYQGGGSVIGCYATGRVEGEDAVGGLVGGMDEAQIVAGFAGGDVTGTDVVGGLVGIDWDSRIEGSRASGAVSGKRWVGGLLGAQNGSLVSGSQASGAVTGEIIVGGLTGQIEEGGGIEDSYALGPVEGDEGIGGLVGVLYSGTNHVLRSYAAGAAEGESGVGGLIGSMEGPGVVSNCYAAGAVRGDWLAGGLVGYQDNGQIAACYAKGFVDAGDAAGGLIGAREGGEVEFSYWDMETSGIAVSAGGEGRNTAGMTYPYAADAYEGWGFADSWTADPDHSVHDGYPFFSYRRIYKAGAGGQVTGETDQGGPAGGTGSSVAAAPGAGAVFAGWCDGGTDPERTGEHLAGSRTLRAFFRSEGGVQIDWFLAHGFEPGEGETWADLDGKKAPGKSTTLREEYIAGTNPHDTGSYLRITGMRQGPEPELYFEPVSPLRRYRMQSRPDLRRGAWFTASAGFSPEGSFRPVEEDLPDDRSAFFRVAASLPPDESPRYLILQPDMREHDGTPEENQMIEVNANLPWSADTEEDWIFLAGGASGSGDGTVTYRVEENESASARTGFITVSGSWITRVFTVYQEGVPAVLSIAPAGREHSALPVGGQWIEVTGNVEWTATGNRSWILITGGASGTGDGTVTYSLEENSSDSSRTGAITVAGGGITNTFNVYQEGCGAVPEGMVPIPGGTNNGTNPLADRESYSDEYPETYSLTVETFYMDQFPVTKGLWDTVCNWAVTNGYHFVQSGFGKAPNHPVHSVNWYDAVKWCNARSEKEGRTVVYTVHGEVYRSGQTSPDVNGSANGYRLPSGTEWEYAARGGLNGKRFPWGDEIIHGDANYISDSYYSYDISSTRGHHPDFQDDTTPYTSPVGSFEPNGYGLYDMAGNVREWCGDGDVRGGSWSDYADWVRCGNSIGMFRGSYFNYKGFRTVCR